MELKRQKLKNNIDKDTNPANINSKNSTEINIDEHQRKCLIDYNNDNDQKLKNRLINNRRDRI